MRYLSAILLFVLPVCLFGQQNRYAVSKDGRWGFLNAQGKLVIELKFSEVQEFKDGVASVRLDAEHQGVIDTMGRWVIEPEYRSVDWFPEQKSGRAQKGEKWGILDATGNWRPVKAENLRAVASMHSGMLQVYLNSGDPAYINRKGKLMCRKHYDEIGIFKGDYAVAQKDEQYGLLKTNGKWHLKPQWDDMFRLSDGNYMIERDDQWGIANAQGKVVISPRFAWIAYNEQGLSAFWELEKVGFMKPDGQVWIVPQFTLSRAHIFTWFSNDREPMPDGELWGYIDKDGKWAITPKFRSAAGFYDGHAIAKGESGWGVINLKGDWVIPPDYDQVATISDQMFAVQKNGLTGIMATSGKTVLPIDYDEIQALSDGTTLIRLGGSWGLVNPQGQQLLPPTYYLHATPAYQDKLIKVYESPVNISNHHDLPFGYINQQGKLIWPIQK